ncbi:hypothetical protein C8R46DRAFT_1131230 [Mycena filopes]|nr:hypothetical protein C8R46DRAFT_1140023 [Mycena filopes]KAJ7145295.1 hypothetical protein C8R46DRAFT_1131230 [Mycena filopes]
MPAAEKRKAVFADDRQLEILNAAYLNNDGARLTKEDYTDLSSATGLYAPFVTRGLTDCHYTFRSTVPWIRAWVVRAKKAKKNGAREGVARRRRVGRPAATALVQSPILASPTIDPSSSFPGLPDPDDSFLLNGQYPSISKPLSDEDHYTRQISDAPGGNHAYYHESQRHLISTYGQHPQPEEHPTRTQSDLDPLSPSIGPPFDWGFPFPDSDNSFVLARTSPTPSAPIPAASSSTPDQYGWRQRPLSIPYTAAGSPANTYTPSALDSPAPCDQSHFLENDDPALRRASLNTWGTAPTFAHNPKAALRSARHTPLPENQSPSSSSEPTPITHWRFPGKSSFSDATNTYPNSSVFAFEHFIGYDNNFESPATTAVDAPVDDPIPLGRVMLIT